MTLDIFHRNFQKILKILGKKLVKFIHFHEFFWPGLFLLFLAQCVIPKEIVRSLIVAKDDLTKLDPNAGSSQHSNEAISNLELFYPYDDNSNRFFQANESMIGERLKKAYTNRCPSFFNRCCYQLAGWLNYSFFRQIDRSFENGSYL